MNKTKKLLLTMLGLATFAAGTLSMSSCDFLNFKVSSTSSGDGIEYSEGLVYTLNEDGASYAVSEIGTCTDKEIVIPLTYKGKPVTAVADWAFYNCDLFTGVVISENITTIGQMAFAGCEGLTEITIPKNVNSLEYGAFSYCTNISSVTISEGVKSLGMMVFSFCNFTSVTIPASVESIGEAPFNACQKLTEIIVSENNAAFKSIDGILYNKDGTNLIMYPMGKTDTTFQISDIVTEIGGYAFYCCSNLTDIDIPDGVRTIGRYALYGCEKLSSIELPDGVTAIKEYTFSESDNLKSIIIGKKVTSIANGVFDFCKNLKAVYFKGSEEEWSKISIGTNNKSLTSATVYYYSENEPEKEGNYWHYVDGVATAW